MRSSGSRRWRRNTSVMSPVVFAGLYRLPPGLYDRAMAMLDSSALVGRERECAATDHLLEVSAGGESSSLVVRGEAGFGKTALLKYAAERGGDRSVLRTVGVEAESDQR